MRRRLIHCQGRKSFSIQARFARIPPQEVEDRLKRPKGNADLPGAINKKSTPKRPVSLSDSNKTPRTVYSNMDLNKDNLITKIRHTN